MPINYRDLIKIIGCSSLLVSCATPRINPDVQEAIQTPPTQATATVPVVAIPEQIFAEINQGNTYRSEVFLDEPRFHVNAENTTIHLFLSNLMKDTPFSLAIHPEVKGIINLDLKAVTIQEVIQTLKELYGYDIELIGKIYYVYPPGLKTETFAVDYLSMKRRGFSSITVNAGGVSEFDSGGGGNNNSGNNNNGGNNNNDNGSNNSGGGSSGGSNSAGTVVNTENEADFWRDLQRVLSLMLGFSTTTPTDDNNDEGGEIVLGGRDELGRMVVVSPLTGLVTVRAHANEIKAMKDFLQISEEILQRQVIIEAKIVEVSLSDEYQQGINWTQALSHAGDTDFIFSTSAGSFINSTTSAVGGVTRLRFQNQDFTGVVSLLQTQGNVQVLSSPRVTVINNQKAVIKVGEDEYFVTEVSTTTVTGNATTTTPEIELTPFFSGIALDVTPQVDEQENIILHVHPAVIETAEQQKVVTLNEQQFVLPLAKSNIRESDTIIKARSEEIVVIGGLMQSSLSDSVSKTPILGDIPFLGELFTQKREVEIKKELVILLKATVVGAGTWQQQIERSNTLMESWYLQENTEGQ